MIILQGKQKVDNTYYHTPVLPSRLQWHSVLQTPRLIPPMQVECTQERKERDRPDEVLNPVSIETSRPKNYPIRTQLVTGKNFWGESAVKLYCHPITLSL